MHFFTINKSNDPVTYLSIQMEKLNWKFTWY